MVYTIYTNKIKFDNVYLIHFNPFIFRMNTAKKFFWSKLLFICISSNKKVNYAAYLRDNLTMATVHSVTMKRSITWTIILVILCGRHRFGDSKYILKDFTIYTHYGSTGGFSICLLLFFHLSSFSGTGGLYNLRMLKLLNIGIADIVKK